MFPTNWGVAPTNETWRIERKAVSHMFYKEKLRTMVEILKEHIQLQYRSWISQIEKNGEHRINIAEEFERINAHALSHICFGEDLNDDRFDLFVYDVKTDTFTERKVSMREAISNMTTQCLVRFRKNFTNPVTGLLQLLFQVDVAFGQFEETV